MWSRVFLAVLLCGLAAGVVMGVTQQLRLTPIILQAERFEVPHAHEHDAGAATSTDSQSAAAASEQVHTHAAGAAHTHDDTAWAPTDGFERTFFTYLTAMLTGAGFAAVLAGVALLTGQSISRQNGWVWGLAGFLAVSLAPAAGLPPELPGMAAAELTARQFWWVTTIIATAAALWILAFRKEGWAIAIALALAVAPHVIGAPQLDNHNSSVPAALASQFASLSLAANALMWLVIGWMLGRFLPAMEQE